MHVVTPLVKLGCFMICSYMSIFICIVVILSQLRHIYAISVVTSLMQIRHLCSYATYADTPLVQLRHSQCCYPTVLGLSQKIVCTVFLICLGLKFENKIMIKYIMAYSKHKCFNQAMDVYSPEKIIRLSFFKRFFFLQAKQKIMLRCLKFIA